METPFRSPPARPMAAALVLAAALVYTALPALAADPDCGDPRARQFDFWIGDWEVVNQHGGVAGRNLVSPILDDCVLQENWSGMSGSAGTSLNFFDPARGRWRQFWVWREGSTLELEGGMVNGSMVLEGNSTEDGVPLKNRITWTDTPGETVRQVWEISRDGGTTWEVLFDGTYWPADARRPADPPPAEDAAPPKP